jgi:plasmid rolling circle replication initiator protein Rep
MPEPVYQLAPAVCDEVLDDRTAAGRQRPWREKRLHTELVAQGWALAGEPGKARRCQDCGIWLTFGQCPRDGTKHLLQASFCRQRLCPMCIWRRSMKLTAEVSAVLHLAAERWPERPFVMLTLTQRNVSGESLAAEVSRILDGWSKLRRRGEFKEVAGWLRTLEVTYNAQASTWHPHLHVLLQVTPSYFTGRGYVSHARWVALWRAVMGLGYDPSVEVHRVRQRASRGALGAAAAEVGKYAVKDTDLTGTTPQEASERLLVLDGALAGRRLVAWGGELRKLAGELEAGEDADLARITGEDHGPTCPVCGSDLAEVVYGWSQLRQTYLRTDPLPPNGQPKGGGLVAMPPR